MKSFIVESFEMDYPVRAFIVGDEVFFAQRIDGACYRWQQVFPEPYIGTDNHERVYWAHDNRHWDASIADTIKECQEYFENN